MKMQFSKCERHHINTYVPEGDAVTVRIPHNERLPSDVPRLLCLVIKVKGSHLYRLQYVFIIVNLQNFHKMVSFNNS